jgi:hypothetical protein
MNKAQGELMTEQVIAATIVALSVLALVVAVVWARDMERFPDGPWDLERDD